VPHVYRRSLPVDVGPFIRPTSETPSSNTPRRKTQGQYPQWFAIILANPD
jgi:hypothetical protein